MLCTVSILNDLGSFLKIKFTFKDWRLHILSCKVKVRIISVGEYSEWNILKIVKNNDFV